MSITISDPNVLAQLTAVSGAVEIRDPSGRVIGTFAGLFGTPPPGYIPPVSDEEIERRRQQFRSGKPFEEIQRQLEGGQP